MARAHPDIPGLVDWQPLARGGFSTVWQARQETLDRLVAVKIDHRTLHDDKEQRRFLREAGSAGRLSGHPGIVTVHDAGILPDDRPYLVMDLCPGGSLTRWLKPEGRQSEERILAVGIRIADALAAAHARGVLHRDVKPANILIDSYDQAGLADFGLAAMPEPGMEVSVTLEGMTPAYAPKEVFYREPPTEFGDVYSLAATLYALFHGRPPRWPETGSASVPELLELQRHPIKRLPEVSPPLMDVLMGALDDEPTRRPTAAEFRDRLRAAADPLAPPSERSGAVAVAGSGNRGPWNRRLFVLVVAAAVLLLAVFVTDLFRGGEPGGAAAAPTRNSTSVAGTSGSPAPADPSGTAAPSSGSSSSDAPSSPGPTPASAPPEGFVDCSAQLGGHSYCVKESDPECWSMIYDYADFPAVGTMEACSKDHAEQTYAAGELSRPVNQKSVFERLPEVRKLCTRTTLDRVLRGDQALKDWQVRPLPVQMNLQDNVFRCLVNIPGGSSKALKLKVPPG